MTRRHHRRIGAPRIAIVLSAAAALSVAATGPGRTVGATCAGNLAPIGNDGSFQRGPVMIDRSAEVTKQIIIGSEGDDDLKGGTVGDVICGRGGNDHIWGNGGADEIYGNSGSDYINGGDGADVIHAGWGLFDEVDASEIPPLADAVLDCGFGLQYCHGDAVDVFTNRISLFGPGSDIGTNPFPLPPP